MYFSTWATAFPNWICGGIGVRKHSESLRDWSVSTCCLQECEYLIGVTISSPPSAKNPHSFQRACHHVTYFKAVFNCSIFSELVSQAEGENPYPKGALNQHHLRNLDLRGVRSIRNGWWLDVSMMLFWQCLAHFPANMSMGKAICSMGSPPEFRRFIYPYITLQWVCFQWWLGSWLHNPRHHIERYNWSHSQDNIDWLDGTFMNIHIIHHCTGHTAIPNHMKIVWGKQEVRNWKHEGPMKYTVFTFFSIGWQSDRNILQRTQAEPSMFFLRSLV